MNETTNVPIPQSEHLNASNPFDDSSRSPATGSQQPMTPQQSLTPGNTPNLMSPPQMGTMIGLRNQNIIETYSDPSQQMSQGGPVGPGPVPGAQMGQSPQQTGIRNPSFHPNMAGMNGPMSNMNGQSPGPPWQV